MTTRYLRCTVGPDSEWLIEGQMQIQVQCTGPDNEALEEGPSFVVEPQQVLKCSDALAYTALMGIASPPLFEEVLPDPEPPAVDIDVDALIAAIVGE